MNALLSFVTNAPCLDSDASQFTVPGSKSQTHGTSAHRWAKTGLQSDRRCLSGQSHQVWDRSKKVCPWAPTLKEIGKWTLVAMFISSVGCRELGRELNITGRSQYPIVQGVNINTSLANPPISIDGGISGYYISCYLHIASNTGNFYSPGLAGSASSGEWSWPANSTLDAINSAFQRLVFEGHKVNISAPLNVQCTQFSGIGAGAVITVGANNFDLKSTDELAPSTLSTIVPSLSNPSSLSQTTSTGSAVTSQGPTTTTSAMALATSPTSVITLSTVANMLSMVATTASSPSQTASSFSQSMSARIPSSTLGSTSQPTTAQDIVHKSSSASDDLNRFGWILIAIAGVLVCLSVSSLLLKKKLKANTLEKGPKNPAAISNGSDSYQQLPLSPQNDALKNPYDIVIFPSASGGQYAPSNLQNVNQGPYTPAPAPLDHRPSNPSPYIQTNAPLESAGLIVQGPGYVPIPLPLGHRPGNRNNPSPYIQANAPLESGTIVRGPDYVLAPAPLDYRSENRNSAGPIVQGPGYVPLPAPSGYASENTIPPVPKFV